jgi:2-aminoadipate transaminase
LQHDHLEHLKKVYGERSARLSAVLRKHLPAGADFLDPQGGFFIWLRLSEKLDATSFSDKARKKNLDFQPGIHFSSRQGLQNYLRLSFSYYDSEDLCEGIKRLTRIFSSRLS